MATPITAALGKLQKLREQPGFEQIPERFDADVWEALFHGLAEDPELSDEEWARKLRKAYQAANYAYYLQPLCKGKYDVYVGEREEEFAHLSPGGVFALEEVADREELFDFVCLYWYGHEEQAAKDFVLEAVRKAMFPLKH
jgi:hypothetical protein